MVTARAPWIDEVHAMPAGPFISDLALAVTNSGENDGACHWLLTLTIDYLRKGGQPHSAWKAFDFVIYDVEAIGDAWPAMQKMATMLDAQHVLPALARFIAKRLPGIWSRSPWIRHAPLTRAVVIADRTHDLVTLFSAGLEPGGSKDPFALRRAANHWLMQIVAPVTIGRRTGTNHIMETRI